MRALIVGDNETLIEKVRTIVLRSGFECRASDIVACESAAEYAALARRELAIAILPPDRQRGLDVLRDMRNTTQTVLLAAGPADDPRYILRALREGADEYLDVDDLETELETTLAQIKIKRLPQTDGGMVIGVLAPGGGSGASTLAVNLATALAQCHQRTALFDLRLAAGDQTLLLDLKPTHTLADLCRNCERMDTSMVAQSLAPHSSGVHLLAAPKTFEDISYVTSPGVRQALIIARTLFPFVVADLDRSFGTEQLAAIVQADLMLVVLRLDIVSLHNTRRVIDYLRELGVAADRVRVVVNRYGQPKELPARKAEQALGIELFHYVPDDAASVHLGINKGIPVILECPRAKISKSIVELARQVSTLPKKHLHNGHGDNIGARLQPNVFA